MKKLEGRALICFALALCLVLGLVFFTVRLVKHGDEWASFYANSHVYVNGQLAIGSVYDRNGIMLLENSKDGPEYNSDSEIRKATLHVVGDPKQNISTAATYAFRSDILGYNLVTGTYGSIFGSGSDLKLTIDAEVSKAAYQALAGRNGLVGVYNWKTGEIICMVSNPGFDPAYDVPSNPPSGTFMNKVLSSASTPGSIFKLVTCAAALENIDGIGEWTFNCTGTHIIEGEKITCQSAHGNQDLEDALANSCNCAFASLSVEMGPEKMNEIVKSLKLTESYDINGIKSMAGSFNFDTYNINLGWAGIGQFEDQVNPLSMMVYMGAIAGGGQAQKPYILMDKSEGSVSLLEPGIAMQLDAMMRNNVTSNYGDSNYPGLELRAKSGTAEGQKGVAANGWFSGYSDDYAFIVCVEKGGYGSQAAGPVANKVMQAVKKSAPNSASN